MKRHNDVRNTERQQGDRVLVLAREKRNETTKNVRKIHTEAHQYKQTQGVKPVIMPLILPCYAYNRYCSTYGCSARGLRTKNGFTNWNMCRDINRKDQLRKPWSPGL